jgi:hypothetical protein
MSRSPPLTRRKLDLDEDAEHRSSISPPRSLPALQCNLFTPRCSLVAHQPSRDFALAVSASPPGTPPAVLTVHPQALSDVTRTPAATSPKQLERRAMQLAQKMYEEKMQQEWLRDRNGSGHSSSNNINSISSYLGLVLQGAPAGQRLVATAATTAGAAAVLVANRQSALRKRSCHAPGCRLNGRMMTLLSR